MATKTNANALIARRAKLLERLSSHCDHIRGSIGEVCSRCKRCNCACGEASPAKQYRLTYKDENQRTRTIYIPKERIPETRRLLANYRKFKRTLKQLAELNFKLYKCK